MRLNGTPYVRLSMSFTHTKTTAQRLMLASKHHCTLHIQRVVKEHSVMDVNMK